MKSLSIAIVIITIIVCGCVFGIPEYDQIQERALAERAIALKERNISVSLVFVSPEKDPTRKGMQIDPSQKQASEP